LGHLTIALAKLRAEPAARPPDGVGAHERQVAPGTGREQVQLALLLEADQDEALGRIRDAGGREERREPGSGRGAVLHDTIRDRRLGENRPGATDRRPAPRDHHHHHSERQRDPSRHRPASRPVHTRIIHGSSASVAPAPVTSGCSRQRDARLGRAGLRESAVASRVCLGWRVVRALLPGAPGGHAMTLRRIALLCTISLGLWAPRIALGVPWYLW